MDNFEAIFSPKSVAVIGASTTQGKVGHDIFANILKGGFAGVLYPVNPTARSILCVKSYPSLKDIPDEVDLAIIILPPSLALKAAHEAIEKNVKGLVIVSAGFREVGGKGLEIENEIVSICRKAGIRIIGPNCLGVINPNPLVKLNASFSARMPKFGNISFISQSGALCTAVLDFAADMDFGFSKFISIGNKADVDELDLLKYLHKDVDTEVIMIYLEELRRGPEFIEDVRNITLGDIRPKPIIAIKSGRTVAGAMAAASHTGALAGTESVYDAIFQQSGIIRVDSIHELFDFASAFAYKNENEQGKLRRKVPAGNKVAIVTNAGGPGIVATDMTVSSGLELAKFSEETIEVLASHLPSTANIHNPVDVVGDAAQDRYENALSAVIRDEGVDGALVILTPQSMTNALGTAESIAKIARRSNKPILCCFMGIFDVSAGVKYLQEHGIPVFRFPENAAKALGALYKYSTMLNRQQLAPYSFRHDTEHAASVINTCIREGKYKLGEFESDRLLECYGFKTLASKLAKTKDEAGQIADSLEFPVVMKIISPQILHKTDAGGVVIGIKNKTELLKTFDEIMERALKFDSKAEITGIMIQQMAKRGAEVILGMNRFPVFGPLLMVGLGGIFVELFQDVVFRLAPIERNEARRMIRQIKGSKLFKGFRGRPACDLESLNKALVSLSQMSINHPEIMEMDINPIIIHEEGAGATVADCRIILRKTKMLKNKPIFPVIVKVPEQTGNLKGRNKVEALSRLARFALEISCRKSCITCGVLNKDQNGAPVPFDGNFWSITHKNEYVGGVVCRKATGLDIEKIKPVSKALLKKIAGSKEWALSDSDKEILFFRFWTSKEAVLKASGKGISGLSDCRIEKIIDDNSLIVKYKNRKWEILHYFFDGHIASIVVNGFDIKWSLCQGPEVCQ